MGLRRRVVVTSAVLGSAVLTVALTAGSAAAYTPGNVCAIDVSVGPGVTLPGTIGADGRTCVPNEPLILVEPILSALDAGLACDTSLDFPALDASASANC